MGRTEDKRSGTEAKVDVDCGGGRLCYQLLLRDQAKPGLEKANRGLGF